MLLLNSFRGFQHFMALFAAYLTPILNLSQEAKPKKGLQKAFLNLFLCMLFLLLEVFDFAFQLPKE
jgi:hypothetical protein